MFTIVFTVFTVVGCFAVVGWLIWVLAHGSGEEDRRAEEAARVLRPARTLAGRVAAD